MAWQETARSQGDDHTLCAAGDKSLWNGGRACSSSSSCTQTQRDPAASAQRGRPSRKQAAGKSVSISCSYWNLRRRCPVWLMSPRQPFIFQSHQPYFFSDRPWRKRNLGILHTRIKTLKWQWNIMRRPSNMTRPTWPTSPTKQVSLSARLLASTCYTLQLRLQQCCTEGKM